MAKSFHQDYVKNDKVECYCDQKLEVYKYFKCKMVSLTDLIFNTSSLSSFARGMSKGYYNGMTQGEGQQNGGVFVLDNKQTIFEHVDSYAGDLPDFQKLLGKL